MQVLSIEAVLQGMKARLEKLQADVTSQIQAHEHLIDPLDLDGRGDLEPPSRSSAHDATERSSSATAASLGPAASVVDAAEQSERASSHSVTCTSFGAGSGLLALQARSTALGYT